jgi:phosphoribosylaminoimidazole (AIR) synthetase
MGWGFAVIVDKTDKKNAMSVLEKSEAQPELIGKVTNKQEIEIRHKNKKTILV